MWKKRQILQKSNQANIGRNLHASFSRLVSALSFIAWRFRLFCFMHFGPGLFKIYHVSEKERRKEIWWNIRVFKESNISMGQRKKKQKDKVKQEEFLALLHGKLWNTNFTVRKRKEYVSLRKFYGRSYTESPLKQQTYHK